MEFAHISSRNLRAGFTMMELIVVVILIGALATFAIPRFSSRVEFDARGFADQTQAMLRYAQKLAIAQRRDVWVQIDQASGNICLTYIALEPNCTTNLSTATNPVLNPSDQAWFKRSAPAGVSYSSSSSFRFSALGRPVPNSTQTISLNGGASSTVIVVESETGYVHQ